LSYLPESIVEGMNSVLEKNLWSLQLVWNFYKQGRFKRYERWTDFMLEWTKHQQMWPCCHVMLAMSLGTSPLVMCDHKCANCLL